MKMFTVVASELTRRTVEYVVKAADAKEAEALAYQGEAEKRFVLNKEGVDWTLIFVKEEQ